VLSPFFPLIGRLYEIKTWHRGLNFLGLILDCNDLASAHSGGVLTHLDNQTHDNYVE
jgi:hypothetical protein